MDTRRGFLAAGGALFCTLSGCTLNSFNLNVLTGANGNRQETALVGSLEVCTKATETALKDMGLFVSTRKDADQAILTGVTKTQRRFTLTLHRQKVTAVQDEKTRIGIEWESDPDDQFWLDLLAAAARVLVNRTGGR